MQIIGHVGAWHVRGATRVRAEEAIQLCDVEERAPTPVVAFGNPAVLARSALYHPEADVTLTHMVVARVSVERRWYLPQADHPELQALGVEFGAEAL